MTTTINVKDTDIEFKNESASQDGSLSFTDSGNFLLSRQMQFANGLSATNMTIGTNASVIATSDFENVTTDSFRLRNGSTLLTMNVADDLVAHTYTFPSTQGAAGSYISNDGSGVLSWIEISSTVDGLSDTAISGVASNNILAYNGSKWTNANTVSLVTITCTSALSSNTITERTGAAGVTVDGLLLKDNCVVNAASVTANNITATNATATNITGNVLKIKGATSSNNITIIAHPSSNTHTLTLPHENPSTNSYLLCNSSGSASWTPITNSYASKRVRVVYAATILGRYTSFSASGSTGATYTVARQLSIGRFFASSMSQNGNMFTINTTGVFKFTVSMGFSFAATTANQFRFSYIRLRIRNGTGGFTSGSITDDGNLGTSNGTIQTTNNKNTYIPANSTTAVFDKIEAFCIFKVATAGVQVYFNSEIGLNGGLQSGLSNSGLGALSSPSLQTGAISYMQLEQLA